MHHGFEWHIYCVITFKWDYHNLTASLSIPGYITHTLKRFKHLLDRQAQHAPHTWMIPIYRNHPQLAPEPDYSPLLDPNGIHQLQEIFGVLLLYARSIDSTMLVALGTLVSYQTKGAQATAKSITQILNYCATHPDFQIHFLPATCTYIYTATPAIYPNLRPNPALVANSFSATNHHPTSTKTNHIYHLAMAPCCINMSVHVLMGRPSARLETMVLVFSSYVLVFVVGKRRWLSLYGCYFLFYVIRRPCSLDILLTKNRTLFNVWFHVRTYIIVGNLPRYLISYNKYCRIYGYDKLPNDTVVSMGSSHIHFSAL